MNYRLILLDYYYQYLFNEGVKYASFCFLDKTYSNNLSKAFFDNQKISVYHIKTPRVFNKEYDYTNVENTILEFALSINDNVTLHHENLDSITKDVYYLKPIKNIDFKYLHIRNFKINDLISLVLFAYSENDVLNVKENELKKLYNNIIKDEEEDIKIKLNDLIVNNSKDYIIDVEKGYYLSDSIRKRLSLNTNYYLKENKDKFKRIKREIDLFNKINPIINTTSIENFNIYFYNIEENVDIENLNSKIRIYSLKDLELKKSNNDYTLLYLETLNENEFDYSYALKYIVKYFKESLIDFYEIYDANNSLVIIIPSLIEQKVIEKIKNELTGKLTDLFIVSLNTAYEIGKNVDIKLLVNYLKQNNGTSFDKKEFKDYLVNFKNTEYLAEKRLDSFKVKKFLYNSYEKELVGCYYGYVHENLHDKQKEYYFKHASNKIIDELINGSIDSDVYFRCNYNLFKSKQIWYLLKKVKVSLDLFEKNIILSEVKVSSKDELNKLVKNIHMLHELGFYIYFDSSVFSSLMLNDLINLYEGIYVEDYEMSLGFDDNENLFQEIIAYYLKQNKKIILNDSLENKEFSHPLIYLIDEK